MSGIAGTKTAQQDFRVAMDDGEQVVEVVGHPAREAADGFHFLGLAELGFQATLFGNFPLRAPDAKQESVDDYSADAVEKVAGLAVGSSLHRFAFKNQVARAKELTYENEIFWLVNVEQIAQRKATHVLPGGKSVEAGQGIVALGKVQIAVQVFQLLIFGQRDRQGLLQFAAPDAFR